MKLTLQWAVSVFLIAVWLYSVLTNRDILATIVAVLWFLLIFLPTNTTKNEVLK